MSRTFVIWSRMTIELFNPNVWQAAYYNSFGNTVFGRLLFPVSVLPCRCQR